MNNKILVVGSGSNHTIENSNFDQIYCANSSFSRLKSISNCHVITSDAFLFNEDILNSLPPIEGLSLKNSNKIRLKKYSKYFQLSAKKIFVFQGPIKLDNRKKLVKQKKISLEDVEFISSKDKWKFFDYSFSSRQKLKIFFRIPGMINKIKFLIQYTLKLKMSLIYRPSMGIFSIMLAIKEAPKFCEIFIDGITNKSPEEKFSIYGNDKVYFSKHAHYMDSFYYDIIIKKFSIKTL